MQFHALLRGFVSNFMLLQSQKDEPGSQAQVHRTSAIEMSYPGNQQIHSSNCLPIIILTHIECFNFLKDESKGGKRRLVAKFHLDMQT